MILVTGAGGKTGRALLKELSRQGVPARALVRHREQQAEALGGGAVEASVGDLLDPTSLGPAFAGISAVYHIPPNVHPQEERIGEIVIELSQQAGVHHLVYHSVLRPYIRAMPHHIKKARVEERIFSSAIPFTILQPAAYMQNTLAALPMVREQGVFRVPYPIDTPLGMIDLEEVAKVGAMVVSNPDHFGATYELAGGEIINPVDIAACFSKALGIPVEAQELSLSAWQEAALAGGMQPEQVQTLTKMFRYYARHGFWGNAHTLTSLLGRPPRTYADFLAAMDLG